MNLRKIVTMGMATLMAVSAMSLSAFAEEDTLIATVPDKNGNLISVYESDLINGEYTLDENDCSISISKESEHNSSQDISLYSTIQGKFFTAGYPNSNVNYVGNDTYTLNFSAATSKIVCTKDFYSPEDGFSSVRYSFKLSRSYSGHGGKIEATVHRVGQNDPMTLYLSGTSTYTATISKMSHTNRTYATVYNNAVDTTISGTCTIN